eukprot:1625355-Amphidinium_carterae.2
MHQDQISSLLGIHCYARTWFGAQCYLAHLTRAVPLQHCFKMGGQPDLQGARDMLVVASVDAHARM